MSNRIDEINQTIKGQVELLDEIDRSCRWGAECPREKELRARASYKRKLDYISSLECERDRLERIEKAEGESA